MKRLALVLAASAVAACWDATGPNASAQYLLLSGVWAASTATPGGSYIKLATYASGGQITGVGVAYVLQAVDSLKISGDYAADGSFGFSITYASGGTATFTGSVQGTAGLTGTWKDWASGVSYGTTFTRLPVPPCADSVPLIGTYDATHPGFFVQFQDTVDAAAEAARLGALYGFTPTHVYVVALKGFAADIPMSTVTVLRCEPKVTGVAYDGVVTIAG